MILGWAQLLKIMVGVGLPILAMFSAWLGITSYGASERSAGLLQGRVEESMKGLAAAGKRAKEREADDARQMVAWQDYSTRSDALRAAGAQSHEKVATYAQTDAGRAPCLDLERVRDIETTAASLGLHPTPAAGASDAALRANRAAYAGPK